MAWKSFSMGILSVVMIGDEKLRIKEFDGYHGIRDLSMRMTSRISTVATSVPPILCMAISISGVFNVDALS